MKIGVEIHAPLTIEAPPVAALKELFTRLDTPWLGLHPRHELEHARGPGRRGRRPPGRRHRPGADRADQGALGRARPDHGQVPRAGAPRRRGRARPRRRSATSRCSSRCTGRWTRALGRLLPARRARARQVLRDRRRAGPLHRLAGRRPGAASSRTTPASSPASTRRTPTPTGTTPSTRSAPSTTCSSACSSRVDGGWPRDEPGPDHRQRSDRRHLRPPAARADLRRRRCSWWRPARSSRPRRA